MTSQHGKELVEGAVYEFYKPDPGQRMEVEIVFMHGLQVNEDDLKDAYYKTWQTSATSDEKKEFWPGTWLKEKYPNARILSLAYDSSARKTETAGNLDPYLVTGCLLDQMVSTAGNIGQNNCPVVFVGHSLGGLIAKEIVVRCHDSDRANARYENLFRNLKAVFFYATPHGGSYLADYKITNLVGLLPFAKTSFWVKYLKPTETERTHIQTKFLQAVNNKDCKIYVVAEGRQTKITMGYFDRIVDENSSHFQGFEDAYVTHEDADHFTVCKPQSKADTGYIKLIECIDLVTKEYESRIKVGLSVTDPIGIEGKIGDISKLLDRPEVSMIGLFGMGGAGKTTLSKALYNLNAVKYVRSCYLENVTSKEGQDVQIVQKKLLQGLYGGKLGQIDQVEQKHLDMIKHCFQTEKVLVVIDDVSSKDYLQELQVFHALETGGRSKVIVTGGDSSILPTIANKVVIEPVNGITEVDGMKLFLRYALEAIPDEADKEKVKTEFLGEAKKIVQLCNGLPLSLEVVGKYLGNSKDKDEDLQQWKETWVDAYDKLQNAQSIGGDKQDKLWSKLRISYDDLDDLEKIMFLDFACIFSEMEVEKRLVERIWGSPSSVKNLKSKSLLKKEGGHYVMHDQLRDMGRKRLLKEDLKETRHPIYLWEGPDTLFSDTYKKFKDGLESDVPYVASIGQEVGTSSLRYSKLRFFNATGCDTPLVDVCLSHCSKELRWLYLKNCSGVTKLGLQKLCSFGGLRVMQIYKCNKIVELPQEIAKLTSLVEMEVVECSNLLSLPNNIGKLTELKRLVIAYCRGLQVLPDSIGDLCKVEHLSFQGCDKLKVINNTKIYTKKLTEKLMQLRLPIVPTTCFPPCTELQRLDIANAQGAKEFPQDFFKTNMPKLEVVNFTINPSVHMAWKNPDGSELVLEKKGTNPRVLEVKRHSDGSISQLSERKTLLPQRSLQFEAFEWAPKYKARRTSASDPQTT